MGHLGPYKIQPQGCKELDKLEELGLDTSQLEVAYTLGFQLCILEPLGLSLLELCKLEPLVLHTLELHTLASHTLELRIALEQHRSLAPLELHSCSNIMEPRMLLLEQLASLAFQFLVLQSLEQLI